MAIKKASRVITCDAFLIATKEELISPFHLWYRLFITCHKVIGSWKVTVVVHTHYDTIFKDN